MYVKGRNEMTIFNSTKTVRLTLDSDKRNDSFTDYVTFVVYDFLPSPNVPYIWV